MTEDHSLIDIETGIRSYHSTNTGNIREEDHNDDYIDSHFSTKDNYQWTYETISHSYKMSLQVLLGRILARSSYLIKYAYLGFLIAISNTVLFCLLLLVIRNDDPNWFRFHLGSTFAPLADWSLQSASLLLLLTYIMSDILKFRIMIIAVCINFIFYGMGSPLGIMVDLISFNIAYILINLYYVVSLLYSQRFVEFPQAFEILYQRFEPYVTRAEFQSMVEIGLVRKERTNVSLHLQGDLVTSLTYIVNGIVKICSTENDKYSAVGYHRNGAFPEAAEWLKSDLDPSETTRYNTNFITEMPTVYIKFPREPLVRLIINNPKFRFAFRSILGVEIAEALLHLRQGDKSP